MTEIENDPLIGNSPQDLIRVAKIRAVNLGKPLYIVKTPDRKFRITSFIPHSASWKKEKYEWIQTILPTEKV